MSLPAPPASAPLPDAQRILGRRGLLARSHPAFEFRPGQLVMAKAVAAALEDRRHLLLEAGTGTGKTLAYLVPALRSGRRVLVSTGTKNLQEQLVFKDIPLLERTLGHALNVVCMKGRNNYACRQKIADLELQPTLLDSEGLEQYRGIRSWAETSPDGDRAELAFLAEDAVLWEHLNARRETCTGQKCARFEDCFLTRLHQRALAADLVVVNHHLFFADLTLKQRDLPGVLPPYEAVIFDEAHELEAIAGQYFGVAASSYQVEDLARDVDALLHLHALWTPELAARTTAARDFTLQLLAAVAASGGPRDGRHALLERDQFLEDNLELYDHALGSVVGLRAALDGIPEKPEPVHAVGRRVDELRIRLAYLLESHDRGVVYWCERRGRGIFLQATPIAVDALLRDHLFEAVDAVILTSATLAVDGDFSYLRQRLGVDSAREAVVASPFDYQRQALLYLPTGMPDPRSPEFGAAAADTIEALVRLSQGRAFVLCTSHEQMRGLHRRLESRWPYPSLLQGTAPRHVLLERFRTTPHAVLFATSSFWQGVDVQGEQLSCVIIDKLPFASPGDPVVAARIHALNEAGRNAFFEFQVPEAVLALKQGFGRLIRSASDRGVLALLDNRILRQRYGKVFLESLPPYRRTSDMEDVREFFLAAP